MALSNEETLLKNAKHAYERGRLRAAWPALLPVGILVIISLALGAYTAGTLVMGALLAMAMVGASWRGQSLGRGARTGAFVGLVPFGAGLSVTKLGHCCLGAVCYDLCLPLCVGGGLAAGALIAWRTATLDTERLPTFAAQVTTASLVGGLGCLCVGLVGLLGLAGGMAVFGLPTAAWLAVSQGRRT